MDVTVHLAMSDNGFLKLYVLDANHEPVREPDVRKWALAFQADRTVARDELGDYLVSTIFLGIDHNWGDDGPPLLFETMVFRDGESYICMRSSTWVHAKALHQRIVQSLLNGVSSTEALLLLSLSELGKPRRQRHR